MKQAAASAIGTSIRQGRERLAALDDLISRALAAGDTPTVTTLRAERSALSVDVPDMERASVYAEAAAAATRKALRRAQAPNSFLALDAANEALTIAVTNALAAVATLNAAAADHRRNYSEADYTPADAEYIALRPQRASRLSPVVAQVLGILRDFVGQNVARTAID